ncbi:MAG: GTPase Era [Bacilli bacterium]
MKSGFVAIIGRPNAGKSTLLNALVGKKISIVSNKPQTTRLAIQGVYHEKNLQIVFVDTPGIHKPKARLGEIMNAQAYASLQDIDVVLLLVDASKPYGPGDQFLTQRLTNLANVLVVFNKIDLTSVQLIENLKAAYATVLPKAKQLEISAFKKTFLEDVIKAIKPLLKIGPAFFPQDVLTNFPESFQLIEAIREQVLHLTYEEIPHSVAITIDQLKSEGNKRILYASIILEKASQKGIIIGKQGSMLRKIRQRVMQEVEKNMGLALSLELFVKVEPNWRDSPNRLKEYGLF